MNKTLVILFLLLINLVAEDSFSLEPQQKNSAKLYTQNGWCSYSGENLLKTYKTNLLVTLKDKMRLQYASMRFFASDYNAIASRIATIEVVDAKSGEFINVYDAFFVVNSKLSSPYSKYLKIAFKNKSDAKAFIAKYSGDIRDFDFTFYMADRDLELDKTYTQNKDSREIKRGKKVYSALCSEIKVYDYVTLVDLKSAIKKNALCKNMNAKNLQAVAKYLWMGQDESEGFTDSSQIQVPKDVKCPVCGMFVAKYPKWVAKISFTNGHAHYFDGAKDMFKYYFEPQRYMGKHSQADFKDIEVTNYYTLEGVDAKEAYFVIGSNVYGPMGHELIPFSTLKEAQNFEKTKFGKEILRFDEVTLQKVFALDN